MAGRVTQKAKRRPAGGAAVRDPEATRKALVQSALRLFEEGGYDATSVQQIVDGAGLTKGAFYHHFESKEEVLHEIHDQFIDFQLDRLRTVLARDEAPDVMLRRVMTEVLMEPMAMYKPEITVFMQERRFLSYSTFGAVQHKRDEFEGLVVDLVDRGIAAGVFRPIGPPRLLAFGLIGIAAWAAQAWLDPKGTVTPREIGEMYGEMLLDGLIVPAVAS